MAEGTELALRCRCGTVRGVARDVTPSKINHCFCYCDDCQAFAHFLGRADDVLDAHGGSEIVQMSQANGELHGGRRQDRGHSAHGQRVSCAGTRAAVARRSATRWPRSALPFIGVVRVFIDAPPATLGPIRGRGFAKSAKGGAAAVPKDGLPDLVMVARVLVEAGRLALARRSQALGAVRRGDGPAARGAARARRGRARGAQAALRRVAGVGVRRRCSSSCAASVTAAAADR